MSRALVLLLASGVFSLYWMSPILTLAIVTLASILIWLNCSKTARSRRLSLLLFTLALGGFLAGHLAYRAAPTVPYWAAYLLICVSIVFSLKAASELTVSFRDIAEANKGGDATREQ